MRYFAVKQGKYDADMPQPKDLHQKIDVRNISSKTGGRIAQKTLIKLHPNSYTVFPDIICSPAMLVSGEAKDIISEYDEYLAYRQVVYMDEVNRLVQLYYMPLPEVFPCIYEKAGHSVEDDLQICIPKKSVYNKSLFHVTDGKRKSIVIRLDLAESLLARGFTGFRLSEIIVTD